MPAETGAGEDLGGAQAVEFDPYVVPWIFLVCHVHVDLAGEDHKALPGMERERMRDAVMVCRHEGPSSGEDVMEQVVVPLGGAEQVLGVTLFSSDLIGAEIDERFVTVHIHLKLFH